MSYAIHNVLFLACHTNNKILANECLNSGYKINEQNLCGQTPLFSASILNHYEITELLLNKGADPNVINVWGNSVRRFATGLSKTYLAKKGAKDVRDSTEGMSPNGINMRNNTHTRIPKSSLNKFDSTGYTPFMWSVFYNFQYDDLLQEGANVNLASTKTGQTALMIACFRNNAMCVDSLLEFDSSSITALDNDGNSVLTYLVRSVSEFNSGIAEILLQQNAQIDQFDRQGKTPLIWSTLINNEDATKFFLSKKSKVNMCDGEGNTALAYASYWGNSGIVKMLLENNADVNSFTANGKSPLSWSIIGNQIETIQVLLDHRSININQIDSKGNTALCYAALYGKLEMVKILVKKGGSCCKISESGNTSLICAVKSNNIKIVEYLLENGAGIIVHSALPACIEEENIEILKVLLKYGADCNIIQDQNKLPLNQAIEKENKEIVETLLAHGADVNFFNEENNVPLPLFMALKIDNFDLVQILLDKCYNRENMYWPLRLAIEKNYLSIFKKIIQHDNVDVNENFENEPSLLHIALKNLDLEIIQILIDNGANMEVCQKEIDVLAKNNVNFAVYLKRKFPKGWFSTKLHMANKIEVIDIHG